MSAWAPVGFIALTLALAPASTAPAFAAQDKNASAAEKSDLHSDLARFSQELRGFRGGDDTLLASLRELAERTAIAGRPDLRRLLDFYVGLSRDERVIGNAAEMRFEKVWERVTQISRTNPEEWPDKRGEIFLELQNIVQTTRDSKDPTAAARVLSFLARLRETRVREDRDLAEDEQRALIDRAREDAHAALALFERIGYVTPRLESLWILARLSDASGEIAAARDGFVQALELARTVGNVDFQVHALQGLLKLAEDAGDVDAQRRRLLDIAEMSDPAGDWSIARRWASLLINDDEPRAAADLLARCRPKGADEQREWHMLFARALRRAGDLIGAQAHDNALVEPDDDVIAHRQHAQLEVARAQSALARHDARAAADIAGAIDTTSCTPNIACQALATLGRAQLDLNDFDAAVRTCERALERGRALDASLERTGATSAFGEIVGLETVALLAEAHVRRGDSLSAAVAIEDYQVRGLRAAGTEPFTRADLVAWAEAAEVGFVTWVFGADTSVVVHVARGGDALAEVIPLGREEVRVAVRRLREAAIAGDAARCTTLGREIEDRLLPASLRPRLSANFAAYGGRVLLLAHGPLEQLPFDLLPIFADESKRTLVPMVLPGIPERLPGDPPGRDALRAWSVLGAPTTIGDVASLPAARREIERVAEMRGTSATTGAAFDRAAFKSALTSGRALHLATHLVHACHDETFGDAGLLLANGDVFCVRDVLAARPALPLAVLAACETDDGPYVDAQALSSVANEFLACGTRNLCVTLWPVADEAASSWSFAFHRALDEGRSPAQAALRARESLRTSGASSADWAAFRFLGRD